MSAISIQHRSIKTEQIHSNTSNFDLDETIQKITSVAMSYFKNGARYILPLITKITRSQKLAESIINGAFSGLVLGIAFIVLGIPTNNFALTCVSGYLFRKHFSLFEIA